MDGGDVSRRGLNYKHKASPSREEISREKSKQEPARTDWFSEAYSRCYNEYQKIELTCREVPLVSKLLRKSSFLGWGVRHAFNSTHNIGKLLPRNYSAIESIQSLQKLLLADICHLVTLSQPKTLAALGRDPLCFSEQRLYGQRQRQLQRGVQN